MSRVDQSNGRGVVKGVRCAIYTRKSSDEGLEQDFNSLYAQRESCEAYIKSQKHEGWQVIEAPYDDGGLSGGTMERRAPKRLLDDIRAGKVNVVVVYKVDRLTRSLADFAKIVETFDNQNVSFVSVTQQFNTTSSMGRLGNDPMDLPEASVEVRKADHLTLTVPARLKRAGLGTKMVIDGPAGRGRKGKTDPSLAKLIVKGHVFRDKLIKGEGASLSDIAVRQGVTRSYFTRLVRLTFLAPDIIRAILDGSHPPTLTAAKLKEASRMPLDWPEQREVLGFD